MYDVQVSDGWVVLANLTDSQLDLTSRETQPDTEQALAGGVAEGFLTYHLILSHYQARPEWSTLIGQICRDTVF